MKTSELKIPVLLASTSPRRIYLMNQVGLTVEVFPPHVDERPKLHENPKALVTRLAKEKAESVKKVAIQRYEKSLIVAADTVVVSPDRRRILGKPTDLEEAKKMVTMLQGKIHTVLTGYSILLAVRKGRSKQIVRAVVSKVKMRPLSQRLIDLYVASGECMDKAGAYAAQGLGMTLIERIEGSYTSVVGLPLAQVFMDLEKEFKISLFSWKK